MIILSVCLFICMLIKSIVYTFYKIYIDFGDDYKLLPLKITDVTLHICIFFSELVKGVQILHCILLLEQNTNTIVSKVLINFVTLF